MSRYDTYQSNAVEAPIMRKWVFLALALSLALHGGLYFYFQMQKLENFGPPPEDRLAKPLRVFKQVKIPEMPKDPEELRLNMDKLPKMDRIVVPTDKPEVQEVHLAPQTPLVPQPLVNEKPKAEAAGQDLLARVEAQTRGAMEKELNSMAGSLLKDSPRNARQPVIQLPPSKKTGDGSGSAEGIPGLKTIDEALSATGPLPLGDKPIGMPGGALYEYDSADLRPEAMDQLTKLGELIRRNPKATFSIEGHTDSFGGPEYNEKLSYRRAEAVKAWLVTNLRIAPERIQTKGLGNTKWIVAPGKSIEEQAPNRRVEIVIKTNR